MGTWRQFRCWRFSFKVNLQHYLQTNTLNWQNKRAYAHSLTSYVIFLNFVNFYSAGAVSGSPLLLCVFSIYTCVHFLWSLESMFSANGTWYEKNLENPVRKRINSLVYFPYNINSGSSLFISPRSPSLFFYLILSYYLSQRVSIKRSCVITT